VGYSTPDEYGALVAGVRANVPASSVRRSPHTATTISASPSRTRSRRRARAPDSGVYHQRHRERAGNAALEEFVMALHTRGQFFGLHTSIETRELARTSRLVSQCTGSTCRPTRRSSAPTHSRTSRIHQDGVLKNRLTYEIMSAETVGWDGVGLVLGSTLDATRCG